MPAKSPCISTWCSGAVRWVFSSARSRRLRSLTCQAWAPESITRHTTPHVDHKVDPMSLITRGCTGQPYPDVPWPAVT
jgi:hypothetical protein